MFADDSTILVAGRTLEYVNQQLANCLKPISSWIRNHGMASNVAKTESMFLLSTVNCISVDRGPSISEDNLELNMNQARDICNPIQSKRDYSAPCQSHPRRRELQE
ncbi:hypothetical protein P5673_021657 [Acropora cervicornis]|uniref:Reverse transcriptase domain-containing protein n=1 Tax=Acropora cervicornis TaxID=6130 RepID=A0AAD9Q8S3_ACRCE|nr:hypothetical protein P5673_021657 [Acropora cervicornis]